MNDEDIDHQLYTYSESKVLRNRFGIHNQATLNRIERRLVYLRIKEGVPNGDFDLAHLQNIHKHLFQDIYSWAGELRQVSIQKDYSQFMPPSRITLAMKDVHTRVKKQKYLRGLGQYKFSKAAGIILGDINHIHPFREGNGRTQLQYLLKLAENAGHQIALKRLNKEEWIKASIEAHGGEYNRICSCIDKTITGRTKEYKRSRDMDRDR